MKKAMSIQSQWLAAGLALLTLVGTSACKKSESEQKNFKAETGMLWWKKEATLVSFPYYIAKAPVPGQSNLAADDSAITFQDSLKSCWYYSEKPEDPIFAANSWSPTAVTLDALFQGMSEGQHKETLKDLRDTWLSSTAGFVAGLGGAGSGAAVGVAASALVASLVICTLGTFGVCGAGAFAGIAALGKAAAAAKVAASAAATAGAIVPAGSTFGAAASTVGSQAVVAALGVGAVTGGVQGSNDLNNAAKDSVHAMTNAEFEAKFKALVASTSAEKRKKLEWNQVQALKDIVMNAPSVRGGTDVCARPEQLDRAAVAAYVGGGTASNATTP
jgi:hypothetical protein